MSHYQLFPAFTMQRKMMIDFDVAGHAVYFQPVTVVYCVNDAQHPIAIYNSKGRKLTRLLQRMIVEDKIQYLAPIN